MPAVPAAEPAKKKGRKKAGADAAATATDEEAGAGGRDGDKESAPVLWRVNYDEFNRRCAAAVAALRLKLNLRRSRPAPSACCFSQHNSTLPCITSRNPAPYRRFRNEVIVETVKAKYGQDAGNAVLGLLLANARFEASVSSRAAGAGVG